MIGMFRAIKEWNRQGDPRYSSAELVNDEPGMVTGLVQQLDDAGLPEEFEEDDFDRMRRQLRERKQELELRGVRARG